MAPAPVATTPDPAEAAAGDGRAGGGAPAPVPRAVGLVAGVVGLGLVAVSGRYGWHRDELYFREAGRHLDWGYVDQPPFTPLVARAADLVAPDSLVALRLVPALACVATVVLGALIVRELGGDRRAQVAGAVAMTGSGFVLGSGHLLSTATFDLLAWMAVLWLVTRLLRTGDPRWWLAIGGAAGTAILNKNLVTVLVAATVVALAVDRRRDLLLTPWALAGAALALAVASPHLLWQAANGWPQAEMASALSERLGGENRVMLLPQQVLLVGPPFVPLWWYGARWLAWGPAGRAFRPLLWMWPLVLVAVFVTGGRPYYAVPLGLVVVLVGVRVVVERGARLGRSLAVATATAVLLALPVLPVSTVPVTSAVNETSAESLGWPELAAQVAAVVGGLPADERDRVVVLAASYGEAGAVDRFGPALGLPAAYSPHNGYHDFRLPEDDGATVVAVRVRPEVLAAHFATCERVATVDNGHDVDNEAQGAPIVVCRGLRGSWADVWPDLRTVS